MYNYIKTCVFVSGKSTQGWIWVLGLFACCIIILCRILRWRRWQSYSWRLLKMTQSLAAPSRIRYIHGRRIWSVTVWISSDLNAISHRCRYVYNHWSPLTCCRNNGFVLFFLPNLKEELLILAFIFCNDFGRSLVFFSFTSCRAREIRVGAV